MNHPLIISDVVAIINNSNPTNARDGIWLKDGSLRYHGPMMHLPGHGMFVSEDGRRIWQNGVGATWPGVIGRWRVRRAVARWKRKHGRGSLPVGAV